ncbi:MAG: hypothetical protein JWQ35_1590 [Bacteriovoracaceae bacterium]|nr:hypothetical protein [Bacteriovoracaceae bacterium]
MYSVHVVAQFRFVEWLILWILETEGFIFEWDAGNEVKSLVKHSVPTEEVEEVFRGRIAAPLGVQESPPSDEERLGLIGPTNRGRLLHIVFTIRNGRVRPISSRPAKRKERILYEKIIREITKRI